MDYDRVTPSYSRHGYRRIKTLFEKQNLQDFTVRLHLRYSLHTHYTQAQGCSGNYSVSTAAGERNHASRGSSPTHGIPGFPIPEKEQINQ